MMAPLTVLHEDAHCLAVVKPAGVLTQGWSAGEPTLEEAVRRYLCPGDAASVWLGTVHRLDRPVSGVVVWAKTRKAARRLADQFAARAARKEYWALVETATWAWGESGTWDDWLGPADESGVVRAAAPGAPRARRGVTRWRWERSVPDTLAWLRLWPETGRTHQLRAQAALRGLPIVGDAAYGSTRGWPLGIALHARSLSLRHPILRTELTWVAPLPESWGTLGIESA